MVLDPKSVRSFINGIRSVTDLLFGTTITHLSVTLDRDEWGEEGVSNEDEVVETTLLCLREPVEMKEWLSLYGEEEIADWKITFNKEYLAENHVIIESIDSGVGDIVIKYADRIVLNGVDYEVYKIRPEADWVGNIVLAVLYIRKWRFTNAE